MITAPTDRVAIEALARELTDEDWNRAFHTVTAFVGGAFATDLLAYLDEMLARYNGGEPELIEDLLDHPALGRAVLKRAKEQGR